MFYRRIHFSGLIISHHQVHAISYSESQQESCANNFFIHNNSLHIKCKTHANE